MYLRLALVWVLLVLVLWSYIFFESVEAKRHGSRHRRSRYYRPGSSCKPRKNCRLSRWCSWSSCSATCGPNGVRVRTRHVIERARCGGRCRVLRQVQRCNRRCLNGGYIRYGRCCCRKGYNGNCCEGKVVNGRWSAWSQWCRCSKSCGHGYRSRVRHCDNPPPSNGGKACKGRHVEHQKCYGPACPVDGQWGAWTAWCKCSKSCGYGQQTRTRQCNNPLPSNGGKDCQSGAAMERRRCIDRQCPVDGGWSTWGPWCQCSTSCGPGAKSRKRHCNSPPPQHGGRNCVGGHVQHTLCNIKPCKKLSYYLKGCYKDTGDRALPKFMGNFKGHDNPVKWCYDIVVRHDYKAFGVQYGGECWSGPTAHITYNKHNKANTCKDGFGNRWANSVYFIGAPTPQPTDTIPKPTLFQTQTPAQVSTKPATPVNSQPPAPLTTEPTSSESATTGPPAQCWGDWSEWSDCSVKCGCGYETRVRFCTCGNGEHGSCSGPSEESRQCNCQACA